MIPRQVSPMSHNHHAIPRPRGPEEDPRKIQDLQHVLARYFAWQDATHLTSIRLSPMSAPSESAGFPSWVRRHCRRLTAIGIGHALYAVFNWFFDNVLYAWVIYRLGLMAGGAVMTFLSLLQCGATLVTYDRMRIDWVGSGALAELERVSDPAWWQRIILWAQRQGSGAIFLVLSILQDAFITTAYFRRGRFDGLRASDWRLFLASVLVSNFYWTLRSGAVVTVLVSAWNGLSSP